MSDPDPRDWSRHPLAPLLSRVEGAISQRHLPGSKAPITAEEMAGALSEERSDPALSEVSILPDYLPVQLPPGRRRLVSTIGDYGMVGSSLTSTAQFLAPPGSPAPPHGGGDPVGPEMGGPDLGDAPPGTLPGEAGLAQDLGRARPAAAGVTPRP